MGSRFRVLTTESVGRSQPRSRVGAPAGTAPRWGHRRL